MNDNFVVKFSVSRSGYTSRLKAESRYDHGFPLDAPDYKNTVRTFFIKYAYRKNDIEITRMPLLQPVSAEFDIIQAGIHAASGLAALYKAGFVHLNVNPENIYYDKSSKSCELGDLNSCREARDQYKYPGKGTPDYTAPEIIAHRPLGFSVDVYSWGLTMLNMMLEREGRSPVSGKDFKSLQVEDAENTFPVVTVFNNDGQKQSFSCEKGYADKSKYAAF